MRGYDHNHGDDKTGASRSTKKDPTKKCAKMTSKLLKAASDAKLKHLKMDDNPLQRRVNFNNFISSVRIILSQQKSTSTVLATYPDIASKIPDYADQALWNFLHSYVDRDSQRLLDEYLGEGVSGLKRLQKHCAMLTYADGQ